jgi:uncharacterized protein (UPF0216 family)|tara:strand:+ start:446 stop:970 length:525 start_codon:yes stop_codon:yes gene_type:complete
MSIQSRGPNNILVLSRSVVPVNTVCDMVCSRQELDLIKRKLPITTEEVFECIEAWTDIRDASENDYIKFDVEFNAGDLNVMTLGISDWMYLSLVMQGRVYFPDQEGMNKLFMLGMEQVITDCLMDLRDGNTNYEMSDLHRIVWEEFERTHGMVTEEKCNELLLSLGVNFHEAYK